MQSNVTFPSKRLMLSLFVCSVLLVVRFFFVVFLFIFFRFFFFF